MPNVHFGTFVILCLTLLRSSCYQRVNSMAASGAAHMKKAIWHFLAFFDVNPSRINSLKNTGLAFSSIFLERIRILFVALLMIKKNTSGIFWHFFLQVSCHVSHGLAKGKLRQI